MTIHPLVILYCITIVSGLFVIFKKNYINSPAILFYISTLYYTYRLIFNDATAFWGINAGDTFSPIIYFFYILLLNVVLLVILTKSERSKFNVTDKVKKELTRLRFFYYIQSIFIFIFFIYEAGTRGVSLLDKYQVTISGLKSLPLINYSSIVIFVINIICSEKNKFHYVFVSLIFLLFIIMSYRGVIVEYIYVYALTCYYTNKDFWPNRHKFLSVIVGVLFYLILAPLKYFIALLNNYLFFGQWKGFDFDLFITNFNSGNEASFQLGIVNMVINSKVTVPDYYIITSFLQHIPFLRFFIPDRKRIEFNSLYQYDLFGDIGFGTASSPVAQMYHAGGYIGLCMLICFTASIVYIRPQKKYSIIMFSSGLSGYLFFYNRMDYDQIFFIFEILFYLSIFPFFMTTNYKTKKQSI